MAIQVSGARQIQKFINTIAFPSVLWDHTLFYPVALFHFLTVDLLSAAVQEDK